MNNSLKKSILKSYIKEFLQEATSAIINPASNITGRTQHQQSASYRENMTNVDNEVTLLKVLENVGDNCFISFIDEYDEFIPRLEVSPNVSYGTPHGNYAYPLNVNSLKDIIEKGRIGGASFAIDRPYFHMFKKSNSLNFIEIQSGGNNNYSGNLEKDLKTIVHTSVIYHTARLLEREKNTLSKQNLTDTDSNIKLKEIKKKLKRRLMISNITHPDPFNEEFLFLTKLLAESVKYNNNRIPSDILIESVDYLTKLAKIESFSQSNMFFKTRTKEAKSDFHILYFVCYMLSNIITDNPGDPAFEADDPNAFDVNKINEPQSEIRQGPIFTMLLNSIDIDFINDKGSGTLHSNEPIQAVYLNSSKKEKVVLIGTFNNIFSTKKINSIDDLFSAYHESSSISSKGVTMNKIVNILEQNPQLNNLFGTELFDDVKLKHPLEDLREKAWNNLTKKESKFFDFILFHSSNKIFNFNMYLERNGSKLIVFDIGFKEKFKNASIDRQLLMIKNDIQKISKIENSLDYISMFLKKYSGKDVYSIKAPHKAMQQSVQLNESITKIQDYLANIQLATKKEKEEFMTIKLFIYFAEEILRILSITWHSTLKNSK